MLLVRAADRPSASVLDALLATDLLVTLLLLDLLTVAMTSFLARVPGLTLRRFPTSRVVPVPCRYADPTGHGVGYPGAESASGQLGAPRRFRGTSQDPSSH